jgi:hypothetical protein
MQSLYLTEDLRIVQKEAFSITCYTMCDMYIWRKTKYIHKKQTHLLVRKECYIRTFTTRVLLKKSLVVGLKGLGAKINWLAVNRQS